MDQKELEHHEIKALQETLLAEEEYTDLSMLFKMFADPTRLRIFTILSQETVCVDDLAAILGMTQSARITPVGFTSKDESCKKFKSWEKCILSLGG
ncbi:ArsR/SmtB family transcription factor [Erysipelothrix piscisicarius]|uniref:ArsR/SmtB family transcription factor n=1 Tax=Erysipelothrix piscisicarius TaxID=2485784 RepID=UPI002F943620